MKVILKQDVPGQGKKGDVINVNDGYARNFLIARGLAAEATAGGLSEIKRRQDEAALLKAQEKAEARSLAESLNAVILTVSVKSGENGKIFGSVTSKEIAEELQKQGYQIDKKQLVLKENIKQLGKYEIEVKVYPEMSAKLKLTVVAE